jgi:hypothetical protein
MSDTLSLLFATTILATGGVCLYMYKSSDEEDQKGGEDYNEDKLFNFDNLFGSNDNGEQNGEQNGEEVLSEDEESYEPKPRQRGGKTKRNRRSGGTKRRY